MAQSLREMVSHRLTFEYDLGTRVIGTLTACAPAEGPVELAVLTKVQVLDASGRVLARYAELPLLAGNLARISVTEGPL